MSYRTSVLHFITRLNVGGPAFELEAIHEYLPGDISSSIVSGICENNEVEFLSTHTISARIEFLDSLQRSIHIYRDIVTLFAIRTIIRRERPDIVHTHLSKAGFLARIAVLTLKNRPKTIHTYHGHVLDGYFVPITNSLLCAVERFLAKRTDLLLCIGNSTKNDLLNLKIGEPDQVHVVPTGLLTYKGMQRVEIRANLEIPADRFVIIFAGRLAKVKRVDRLRDVILGTQDSRWITWLIAGQGDDFNLLQELKDYEKVDIRFLGWRSDLDSIFNACDLSILVSDNEGTPLTIVHAGMHGVPTLSTNVGSVADLIEDNVNGFLVEPTSHSLISKLNQILGNPSLLDRIGLNCQNSFREKYSGELSSKIHADLYRAIKKR